MELLVAVTKPTSGSNGGKAGESVLVRDRVKRLGLDLDERQMQDAEKPMCYVAKASE